jgi:hypothetical protein
MPLQLHVIHKNIRGADYFVPKKENQNANSPDPGKSQEPQIIRHGESS